MTLNKKILAAAIVGGLFATAAQAQVTISATTPVPVTFASELVIPSAAPGTLTLTNAANALDLVTALRYSFSSGEVRYARVECPTNIRFAAGSAVTASSAAALGAINGLGTNAITFSITATDASTTATSTVTVSGNRSITATTGGACSYSLYDQPSQAQAGGTTGRIATVTGNYIAFARSYELDVTPAGAVANVEADPAFSRFVSATPTNSVDRAQLGEVLFDTRANVLGLAQPRLATGVASTLADLLSADSAHVIEGDFSAAANSNGSFTGAALNRVYFSLAANCSTVDIPADEVTATDATFVLGATAVNTAFLCYAPRATVAIPVSGYTQTFVADSADAALYAPTNRGPIAHGDITRNGTQLQAQFAQVPAGWLSRIVLTNTGPLARPYTITAQTEAGVTATLGTAATGSVPANGTIVLNTADIATFTGQPRGTLNVTVAGPNSQIQGLYQIVNGQTGSIANTALVRPGTN
jgi:hypothetical protein